jgi:hypothetical protein
MRDGVEMSEVGAVPARLPSSQDHAQRGRINCPACEKVTVTVFHRIFWAVSTAPRRMNEEALVVPSVNPHDSKNHDETLTVILILAAEAPVPHTNVMP